MSTIYTAETRYKGKKLSETVLDDEYDYIVVGAGSAGCALAARLSEDSAKRVLLLESGDVDVADAIHIPAAVGALQRQELDWNYRSIPLKNSHHGANGNISFQPRGRVMGGSSSINYMLYVRPAEKDLERWENKYGCTGWGPEGMQRALERVEDVDTKSDHKIEGPGRFQGGKMGCQHLQDRNINTELFIEAAKANGHPFNPDYNSSNGQRGVSHLQYSHKQGRRWNVVSGYLLDALDRPNLHILTQASTMKVNIDPQSKTATGVTIRRGPSVEAMKSAKDEVINVVQGTGEVIVTSGSLASPQILMLSGVGPAAELQKHGIKCLSDLPVGQNLQDHISCPMYWYSQHKTLSPADLTPDNLNDWATKGRGPLTSAAVEAFLFYESRVKDPDFNGLMDQQWHVCMVTGGKDIVGNMNVRDDIVDNLVKHLGDDKHTIGVLPTLLHPKSNGTVTLKSANGLDHPVIDPNYLSEEVDLENCAEACKHAYDIMNTEPMKSITEWLGEVMVPEIKGNPATDMDYWRQWVRYFGTTLYHPTTTCKMAAEEDPTGVVTPDCRVKGIKNLRVVDASIMPEVCSGNTNIPTISIAEKASEIIKSGERIPGKLAVSAHISQDKEVEESKEGFQHLNINEHQAPPALSTGNRQPSLG